MDDMLTLQAVWPKLKWNIIKGKPLHWWAKCGRNKLYVNKHWDLSVPELWVVSIRDFGVGGYSLLTLKHDLIRQIQSSIDSKLQHRLCIAPEVDNGSRSC